MTDDSSGKQFVRINGKILGPFEIDQLRSLRDRGRLHAEHEISVDRRQWEPAGRLAALFDQPKIGASSVSKGTSPSSDESEPAGSSIEWFYSSDSEQSGPVSFRKLQSLARKGELQKHDLIWQQAFTGWIPAKDQPGLFDSLETNGNPKDRIAIKNGTSIPGGQTIVWDLFLNAYRDLVTEKTLDQMYRVVVQVGGLAMTIASIIWIVFVLLVAIKGDSVEWCLWGVIAFACMSAAKYSAVQLSLASDELIKSTPNTFSSAKFCSTTAAVALLAGFCLSAIGFFYTLKLSDGIFRWNALDERWIVFAYSIQFPLSFFFLALAALHPAWMNMLVVPGSRAGFEGIAIRSFRLKLAIRFAAAWFGVGALLGVAAMTWAVILMLFGEEYLPRGIGCGIFGTILLISASLPPILAYKIFTWLSVNLDVKQAILSIAARDK